MVFRSLLERPHRTWLLIAFACCILEMQSGCRVLRRRAERAELDNARQLSLRGTDALDRDRYQDAELLFAEALQNCPNDERAQWGYAQTLWQRGATESAIEHMREAIRLSGKNAEYRVRLGEMYLAIGELQSAGMERSRTRSTRTIAMPRPGH